MNENELRSIKQGHIQAVLGLTAHKQNERELVKQGHRIAVELDRIKPPPPPEEPPAIHDTELPEAKFVRVVRSTPARLSRRSRQRSSSGSLCPFNTRPLPKLRQVPWRRMFLK